MATYCIDTAKAFDNLVDNGVEEKQARAIVETFSRTQDDLASKQDLDLAMEKLGTDLTGEIQKVRTDLSGEMQKVRTDLTGEMQKVRTDMSSQFKWMIGTFIAIFIGGGGLLFTLLKLFG